ncbi:hypothetical protein JNUCC32_13310 [Paenibacillus sp. JNUCC32]|uniref:hypothetical protein n=1 Tax=Paenibacillus sp. JNUCC32 TaxID=2777984 RepID=UPI00178892E5|nr:hypothetical protein [Paenibacillus sp. JNUCC-32]QOT12937.1 hypothetical protein JNUCC32_13310 [Paenibacillus sp. JNUCC-32]
MKSLKFKAMKNALYNEGKILFESFDHKQNASSPMGTRSVHYDVLIEESPLPSGSGDFLMQT